MIKNSKLQNMFKLSSKVVIYVPSTTDINVTIDNTTFVNNTATMLSNCFGGATSTVAVGYWNSPTAGLVKEKTTMVFAYASESDLEENIDTVVTFCESLKSELKQDAIALEINGEMYFI